jgi:hypothetical protein
MRDGYGSGSIALCRADIDDSLQGIDRNWTALKIGVGNTSVRPIFIRGGVPKGHDNFCRFS